ncbi:MAG: DNA replication/repair protein RecF [Calditrichaeota bacterium]|nr:DNA replication/repair protein RecF [Calditrichota bacterium]
MYVSKVSLTNFRNYATAEIELSEKQNFIFGLNAQGKTNFLEAVYLLCLGRSFRQARNQELVKRETTFFNLRASLFQEPGIERLVIINYNKDEKKEISIDRKRLSKHSKIFGQFPVVVMAPDEFRITTGAPAERRRFIDVLLSQLSLSYLNDLQEYNRTLKQRNKILQNFRDGLRANDDALEAWTQQLANVGGRIIELRHEFIGAFCTTVGSIYHRFTQSTEKIEMTIESSVKYTNNDNNDNAEGMFLKALSGNEKKERILGATMVGPHRDDVIITIDGMDLRKYGSRGEHKSVLISIKIAEFKHLQERINETPVLLLDDCYSELDNFREQSVFGALDGLGQIILTSPKEPVLSDSLQLGGVEQARFIVEDGHIEPLRN